MKEARILIKNRFSKQPMKHSQLGKEMSEAATQPNQRKFIEGGQINAVLISKLIKTTQECKCNPENQKPFLNMPRNCQRGTKATKALLHRDSHFRTLCDQHGQHSVTNYVIWKEFKFLLMRLVASLTHGAFFMAASDIAVVSLSSCAYNGKCD